MNKKSTALFSRDRTYRYLLTRTVGPGDRAVNFVMLNPSTADEERNDRTLSRCIGFARGWGFGYLLVTNLSPFRSALPKDLFEHGPDPKPVEKRNLEATVEAALNSHLVVLAYGNHGGRERKAEKTLSPLEERGIQTHTLGITMQGHPRHPLYVRGDTKPVPFDRAAG